MKGEKVMEVGSVPVFGLSMESDSLYSVCSECDLFANFPNLFTTELLFYRYRAVSIDRWSAIRSQGVDIRPTDGPFYCDQLEKAMEYGEWPKIVMGFSARSLDRTFREVDSGLDVQELNELERQFPSVETSIDGSQIWLSRLRYDDPRRASPYEVAYGAWIPGSPWEALQVLFLVDRHERNWSELALCYS